MEKMAGAGEGAGRGLRSRNPRPIAALRPVLGRGQGEPAREWLRGGRTARAARLRRAQVTSAAQVRLRTWDAGRHPAQGVDRKAQRIGGEERGAALRAERESVCESGESAGGGRGTRIRGTDQSTQKLKSSAFWE